MRFKRFDANVPAHNLKLNFRHPFVLNAECVCVWEANEKYAPTQRMTHFFLLTYFTYLLFEHTHSIDCLHFRMFIVVVFFSLLVHSAVILWLRQTHSFAQSRLSSSFEFSFILRQTYSRNWWRKKKVLHRTKANKLSQPTNQHPSILIVLVVYIAQVKESVCVPLETTNRPTEK